MAPKISHAEIQVRVAAILSEQLGVDESECTPDAQLQFDLSADELDIVELVMALEEEYKIEISDETAEGWKTVANVIDYIVPEVN